MSNGGYTTFKTVGTVIAALSLQAVIRGLFTPDDPLWGGFTWAPGGHDGQLGLLVCAGLVGAAVGGWAHLRQKRLAVK